MICVICMTDTEEMNSLREIRIELNYRASVKISPFCYSQLHKEHLWLLQFL